VNDPGAENPRARPTAAALDEGIVRGIGPKPIAERGGGIEGESCVSRFLGLGRRGGTRRLKLATTSGGEWRFRVGWAGRASVSDESHHDALGMCLHQVLASGSSMAGSTFRRLTLRMKP
jgi:hypothetical protein